MSIASTTGLAATGCLPLLLPVRLREERRLGAGDRGWAEAVKLAALPLAGPPDVLADVVDHLHLAEDGVELAGPDRVGDLLLVEAADLLDRLLQHLQAGIGHRARPAVGVLAGYFLMVLEI